MRNPDDELPQQIRMTADEAAALKKRIENSGLSKQDIKVMKGLIAFNEWLHARLSRAKLTIKRLRQIFGFKSESRKKPKSKSNDNKKGSDSDTENVEPSEEEVDCAAPDQDDAPKNAAKKPKWDTDKNHGRQGHEAYTGCPQINVPLEGDLFEQGFCPDCAEHQSVAKVSSVEPMVLVFLESQPLVFGHRYNLERVRCNLCKTYFTAPLPEAVKGRGKYDESCKTALAINHYYAGLPFTRLEMLQKAQGIPLADSTQFDLIDQLYQGPVKPVFSALQRCAAQGTSLFFDDTTGRILEQIAANKKAEKRSDKKSVHATAILSEYEGHRIYLFQTNMYIPAESCRRFLSKVVANGAEGCR